MTTSSEVRQQALKLAKALSKLPPAKRAQVIQQEEARRSALKEKAIVTGTPCDLQTQSAEHVDSILAGKDAMKEILKAPVVAAALVLAIAAVLVTSIVMWPTYRCISTGDGMNESSDIGDKFRVAMMCLHGT